MAGNIKEKILEATLELANEKGIGRISVSQIAAKVGLKKSSIYSHYSSKDEIIEEMYKYFRSKAVKSRSSQEVDYGALVEGHSLKEILTMVVSSYIDINSDSDMNNFYRAIMSERALNPAVAEIMVMETRTMILATKQLFYAIQAKKIADFGQVDAAAVSFAMGVHAVIEYMEDAKLAGSSDAEDVLDTYIEEFCRVYG